MSARRPPGRGHRSNARGHRSKPVRHSTGGRRTVWIWFVSGVEYTSAQDVRARVIIRAHFPGHALRMAEETGASIWQKPGWANEAGIPVNEDGTPAGEDRFEAQFSGPRPAAVVLVGRDVTLFDKLILDALRVQGVPLWAIADDGLVRVGVQGQPLGDRANMLSVDGFERVA